MHHLYTRRLVILMVSFFAVAAIVFGGAAAGLRDLYAPPAAENTAEAGAVVLPSGETTFNNLCSSCHQADELAGMVSESLDPDATSLGQLEFLIGPPAHGGASPAEALAVVVYFRTLAGLPSTYEPGVPTPPAVATEVAARPTLTQAATVAPAVEAGATETTEATEAVEPLEAVSDFEAAFEEACSQCHRPRSMIRGLGEVEDPETASLQAIEFIATSRKHRNVDPVFIVPAFNYIRQEAGFDPLGPEVLDQVLAEVAAEATPDS
jgi:mono/diheme cytochrome c family protein